MKDALCGVVAYIIFTQIVLGVLAYENVGTRKEWGKAKFRTHRKALTSWFIMIFGTEQNSVVTIGFLWLLSFALASVQSVLAAVTFGVFTLLFPVLLICRCIWCCYKSQTCPPPP